jgi:hypothetical protein
MIEIPFVALSIRDLQLAPLNSMLWLETCDLGPAIFDTR